MKKGADLDMAKEKESLASDFPSFNKAKSAMTDDGDEDERNSNFLNIKDNQSNDHDRYVQMETKRS
jgi:hypothetical protein